MSHRPINVPEEDHIEIVLLGSERDVHGYWTVALSVLLGTKWYLPVDRKVYWLKRMADVVRAPLRRVS